MNPASIIAVWVLCSCGAFVLAQSPVTSPAIYTHGRVVSPTNPGEPSWQLPLVCSWPGSAILTYWSGTSITVQIDDLSFWQPEASTLQLCSTHTQTHTHTAVRPVPQAKCSQPSRTITHPQTVVQSSNASTFCVAHIEDCCPIIILACRLMEWHSLCFSRRPTRPCHILFLRQHLVYITSLSLSSLRLASVRPPLLAWPQILLAGKHKSSLKYAVPSLIHVLLVQHCGS